ncbi:isoaspartyl peptidase/L-asparaginase family protein [Pelotomaculum propionicicum]|mgnify:CR=1 FL=1|uniref:Isoaspartyl peptidase n=1 Tax=Pelotomaculum propionicicum TaxID=258475 RepID=A0A4Y7RTD9_9FIRM|nr:isoaspartyl peptidase/L-asparaginase [Pelotomaculum propionicicum]TEB12016.1 Isoaspartyl peptidase [Pelotomaculum propionicicum]
MHYAQTKGMGIIALHGGLDTSREKEYMAVLQEAALLGYGLLAKSRTQALEAVLRALEDSPKFNCGYGSVLNMDGEVEMDAAIVDGPTVRFSAVAAIRNIQNPISVARVLMEKTNEVILAGDGAFKFARQHGFPKVNCISEEQLEAWRKARESLARGETPTQNLFTGLEYRGDTVGCVTWDGSGLAAASSTGGCSLKKPGRVGDTPSLGGGIFASGTSATVCTGVGEAFIETLTAKFIDEKISAGASPQEAVELALKRLYKLKKVEGGILSIDAKGQIGSAFNAGQYPVVVVVDGKLLDRFEPVNIRGSISMH